MLPMKVMGIIDTIDEDDVIHDAKTARKRGNQDLADGSDQLSWYELLHRARYRKPTNGLVIDQLVQTHGGKLSVNRFETTRDVADLRAVVGTIKQVAKMIEREVFLPAPDSAWWCSPRWCGYHSEAGGPCPYGRRTKRPTT